MADDGGKVELEDDNENSKHDHEGESNVETDSFEADLDEQYDFGDTENYWSTARKPTNGTIPENVLEFFYSYGYNCRKYFNLCVIDKNTIAFAAGNFIQFLDVQENKVWFKTGSIDTGIGHISKNPVLNHIAVGANGVDPLIVIYNWPSMKAIIVLKGGTTKRYLHLAYSPDGLLLASQGGEPDFHISIWNWKQSKIILQCISYVQDVHNITFSKYIPGQLTSSGVGHIKFWKMCTTFTGLKLKGEIGKFGNTEISDIIAIHPMPNETIVSGCEWGNILLWDESLIKLEACRRNKETAHISYITQFEYINGELISVGSDGWIRFWFYETIDQANLSDDEQFLEIQPIYEFEIGENGKNTMLMSIQKVDADNPEKTTWYAQDGNGGIWLLDLCTSGKERKQKKIFTCHAGPIVDMDTADWGPFVATLDKSGSLHIYNYLEKKLQVVYKFFDKGCQVIWLPCKIDRTGSTLLCAFESGIIRMVTIAIQKASVENNFRGNYTKLVQVLKPHLKPINVMCLNTSGSLLVTGSADSTIFTFNINSTKTCPTIVPIGYVKLPSYATCMAWNPQEEATLLIGCFKGQCVEVKLPTNPQSYTSTSYELVKCNPLSFNFASVKSSIQRDTIKSAYEKEKERKLQERRIEMERLRVENPHIVIDEETFLMDLEEGEMVLPEIYIPEIPNKVLIAQYSINGEVWLFMSGFDAGYIYEYPRPLSGKVKQSKPTRTRIVEHAKDTEIHNFLFNETKTCFFLGTQHGELYLARVKENDPLDFSDCWILPVHDYYNGHMSKILFSYDNRMLLTCGNDGNIFCFKLNEEVSDKKQQIPTPEHFIYNLDSVEDIEDPDYPSLEQVITRMEQNRIISVAEQKKKQVLAVVRNLMEEYVKITERNKQLLQSQQISNFELDPRIAEDLEQQLNAQKVLTEEKLNFQVEKSKLKLQKLIEHFITPITCLPFAVSGVMNESRAVHSLRELKLNTDAILKFMDMLKHHESQQTTEMELQQILDGEVLVKEKEILDEQKQIKEKKYEPEEREIEQLEGLLGEDFSNLTSGLGLQINQLLSKYKQKRARMMERQNEWQKLHERKPNLAKNRVEDEAFLEKAKQTIGECNLKSNVDFSLTKKKEVAAKKYKQLLNCRSKLHNLREDFNSKLKMIALEKQRLLNEVLKFTEILKRIHMEIPPKNVKPLPQPPKINLDVEFPEHKLELEKYISMSEKMQQVKRQRQSFIIDQSIDHFDVEYDVLYSDDKMNFGEERESVYTLISSSKLKRVDDLSIPGELIKNLNITDSIQTTWEREMKHSRMWRKIQEQDFILQYIDDSYKQLEQHLDELEEYRLNVIYESTYMNLIILTLYEEFIILRDSEAREHILEEKVNKELNERSLLMNKMQATSIHIAAREEEIRKLYTRIKDIATEYSKAIADNKYQDFLYRIFKKKYTEAKKQNGGSSNSVTDSSETSSEETDGTIDSEAEYIPFDENISPPGCDKDLYEKAFSMREKRYEYEFQIKEEQREIELLQKELDNDTKLLKFIENKLKTNQEQLQDFMLEKQKKLNDINVTVILKLHQMQHILDSGHTEDIQNCVVFDKQELSNLYARVGELQEETCNLEEKRKKSEVHLKRIKMDLKYMKTQNKELEAQIKEKMIQKFGRKVSLINLYETILQRLIYDTKTDVRTIMKNFTKDIKKAKLDCSEGLITLENLIKNNTEKLSLLTVLEKEKLKLKKMLELPTISEENMLEAELEHKADIAALENILHNQIEQRHMLQHDIERLRTGPRKLPALCLK